MNKTSLKITTGAMVTAIFGVFLLLNRQTGNFFQEIFLFLYPIPLVAYAALYGIKSGLPVLAAMSLLSLLFGNFTSVFYAVTQAFIGLVFGGCLHHKVEMTKILFAVMILSALVSLLNTVFLGFLFGFDLNQEVAEMQAMIHSVFEQTGVAMPEIIMSTNYLKQIFVVSMILLGVIQGFLVYEISLLILRRLRFPVQKPKSVFLYTPPRWTGYVAMLAFLFYNASLAQPPENGILQNTGLTFGIFSYLYLLCFGAIAVVLTIKVRFPRAGALGIIAAVIGLFMFPLLEMAAGFIYLVTDYHHRLVDQYCTNS